MSVDLLLKKGDRRPIVRGTAQDGNGDPKALTGAESLTFYMRHVGTGELKINGATASMDGDQVNNPGRLWYEWADGDTDTTGEYHAEFKVDWGGGEIETVPQARHLVIVIAEDVA